MVTVTVLRRSVKDKIMEGKCLVQSLAGTQKIELPLQSTRIKKHWRSITKHASTIEIMPNVRIWHLYLQTLAGRSFTLLLSLFVLLSSSKLENENRAVFPLPSTLGELS